MTNKELVEAYRQQLEKEKMQNPDLTLDYTRIYITQVANGFNVKIRYFNRNGMVTKSLVFKTKKECLDFVDSYLEE